MGQYVLRQLLQRLLRHLLRNLTVYLSFFRRTVVLFSKLCLTYFFRHTGVYYSLYYYIIKFFLEKIKEDFHPEDSKSI